MSESLTIIVYQSFQWTSFLFFRSLDLKELYSFQRSSVTITLVPIPPTSKCLTLNVFPDLFLLSFSPVLRFGVAKVHILFSTTKYFSIFSQNIFNPFLLLTTTYSSNSKNGRAKIHTLLVFSKQFSTFSLFMPFHWKPAVFCVSPDCNIKKNHKLYPY